MPNVAFPTGIAFADTGTMYFTEREGRVRVFEDGRLRTEPLASGPTSTSGEMGFLGLDVSPDGQWVYVFASDPEGDSNHILRVPTSGGELEPVIEDLPGGGYHNGGGVAFAPDGMLLVSNGEIHDSNRAQDPDELGGKVYRYTPEGEVPDDNPFGESPTYALGLRNPYGLAIDPVSGAPFVTENGPTGDDEVNRIEPRGNYGWPAVTGEAGSVKEIEATLPGTYHEPLVNYEDSIVPTGIAFADPQEANVEYAGDLFFGAFGERTIHRLVLDEERQEVLSDEILVRDPDPTVAVAWGPDGLYYSTVNAIKLLPIGASGSDGPTRDASDDAPSDPPGLRLDRILLALGVLVIGAAVFAVAKKRGRA